MTHVQPANLYGITLDDGRVVSIESPVALDEAGISETLNAALDLAEDETQD